ncbi:unnamed protein product [Ostreobium quekettii]|uniref:B-block binding subunit of TFIIIC n=1 Tax=Ostreobium quekettii TaxID=121088 RepID=A0A8S1IRR3_9CHLO|nr:unnamed protein product [Ostreobium quekettii]
MDALFASALEQIALEGHKGCSLPRLWETLREELPIGGVAELTEGIKQVVWDEVRRRKLDVQASVAACHAAAFGLKNSNVEHASGQVDVDLSHANLGTVAGAEGFHILLVASQELRDCVLGVYDLRHCRFRLSSTMMQTLEAIGATRHKGAVQCDLATNLDIPHKNFFFVLKHLENRGLIVKNQLLMTRPTTSTHALQTNIVHLRQFAPANSLPHFERFEADHQDSDDDVHEGGSRYSMSKDAPMMRSICERISATDNKVLLERDLKMSFGFRFKTGHRVWRRLQRKMRECRLIERFVGTVDGKPVVCIRLLMNYNDWQRSFAAPLVQCATNIESRITVENSLQEQLYEHVLQAGLAGLTSSEIMKHFRLSHKHNMVRLTALSKRFGMLIHSDTEGKVVHHRCICPPAYVHNASRAPFEGSTVHVPPGGWMKAVVTAIMAGKSNSRGTKVLTMEEHMPHRSDALPPKSQLLDTAHPANASLLEENLGPEAGPGNKETDALKRYLQLHVLTKRSDFRFRKLMDKLQADGFVFKFCLKSFFRDVETAEGFKKVGHGPDRRTLNALIKRLVTTAGAKTINVSLLTKEATEKLVEVILPGDVQVTEELLKEIRDSYLSCGSELRKKSHVKLKAKAMQALGEKIPVMDKIERLIPDPKDQNWNLNAKDKGICDRPNASKSFNGFIWAKMVRAKLLHYLICRMVGLGGFQRCIDDESPPPSVAFPAWKEEQDAEWNSLTQGQVGFSTASVRETASVHVQRHAFMLSTNSSKYSFTPRQLWDFMPIDLFLQIVGTSVDSGRIEELCGQSKTMSDFPEEKLREIIDDNSRTRMSRLLDILCRMDLIESAVTASTSCMGLHECSRFFAHDKGVMEVPEAVGEGQSNNAQGRKKKMSEYDLTLASGLDEYWTRLEFNFTSESSDRTRHCFPSTMAPEVCSKHSWRTFRLMSMPQWLELRDKLKQFKEGINWKQCQDLATKLELSTEQVFRLFNTYGRAVRLERLQSGLPKDGWKPCRKPRPTKRARTQSRTTGSGVVGGRLAERRKKMAKKEKSLSQRSLPLVLPGSSGQHGGRSAEGWSVGMENGGEFGNWQIRGKAGYWSQEEDKKLFGAFLAMRCCSKSTKLGHKWKDAVGLPCPKNNAEGINRCKRRLGYCKKIPEMKHLLMRAERLAQEVYLKRLALMADTLDDMPEQIPGLEWPTGHQDEPVQARKASLHATGKRSRSDAFGDNYTALDKSTPATIKDGMGSSSEVERLDARLLNGGSHAATATVETTKLATERPGKDKDAQHTLELMLTTCEPEIREEVEQLCKMVDELTAMAPRSLKNLQPEEEECDGPPCFYMEAAAVPASLGSSVVFSAERKKRLAVRVNKASLPRVDTSSVPLAAMVGKEFILSILFSAVKNGFLDKQMAAALTARFTDAEIRQAVALLYHGGWVQIGGPQCPLKLSSQFMDQLKVDQFPEHLFDEAVEGYATLSGLGQPAKPSGAGSLGAAMGEDGRLALHSDVRVSGGTVAAILAAVVSSQASLVLHWDTDGESRCEGIGAAAGPVSPKFTLFVRSSAEPSHGCDKDPALEAQYQGAQGQASDRRGRGQRRGRGRSRGAGRGRGRSRGRGERVTPVGSKRTFADLVRDALDADGSAGATCWSTKRVQTNGGAESLHSTTPRGEEHEESVCRASEGDICWALARIRRRKEEGITLQDLCAKAQDADGPESIGPGSTALSGERAPQRQRESGAGGPCHTLHSSGQEDLRTSSSQGRLPPDGSVDAGISRRRRRPREDALGFAVQCLCRRGLARGISGHSETVYVATEHSSRYLAHPPHSHVHKEAAGSDTVDGPNAAGPSSLANSERTEGTSQQEVHIRPWLDHTGAINREVLKSLQQKILMLVMSHPGRPECTIIDHLSFMCPSNVKELLQIMVGQSIITCRTSTTTTAGPPSILRATGVEGSAQRSTSRHYFPNLSHCFAREFPAEQGISCRPRQGAKGVVS